MRTVDPCISCTFHFIVALFYELRFLKKVRYLSEIGLLFSEPFLLNCLAFI
jgi:hypothetical protein